MLNPTVHLLIFQGPQSRPAAVFNPRGERGWDLVCSLCWLVPPPQIFCIPMLPSHEVVQRPCVMHWGSFRRGKQTVYFYLGSLLGAQHKPLAEQPAVLGGHETRQDGSFFFRTGVTMQDASPQLYF